MQTVRALGMALAIALPEVAGLVACSQKWTCDLGGQLSQRAGGAGKDCGHATLEDAGRSAVDDCVVSAFEKRQAFVAQYDRIGTDSKVVFGIAGDASGAVTFLRYDGDPSGGSHEDPVISADKCNSPEVDTASDRDPETTPPIKCGSTTSLGQTCGAPREG